MKLASTIALTGNSGIYAAIDCDFNYSDRALWAEYSIWCSGCLDATTDVPAGSVVVFQSTPSFAWPSCSIVSR